MKVYKPTIPMTLNRAKTKLRIAREVQKKVSELNKEAIEEVDHWGRIADSLSLSGRSE